MSSSKRMQSGLDPYDQQALDQVETNREANIARGIGLVGLVWVVASVLVVLIVLLATSIVQGW